MRMVWDATPEGMDQAHCLPCRPQFLVHHRLHLLQHPEAGARIGSGEREAVVTEELHQAGVGGGQHTGFSPPEVKDYHGLDQSLDQQALIVQLVVLLYPGEKQGEATAFCRYRSRW